MIYPAYGSAFSPSRHANNAMASSPIRNNTGSPRRNLETNVNCFVGDDFCLHPRQLHFEDQATAAYPDHGFETPRRSMNSAMPRPFPDPMMDRRLQRRTSPTSVASVMEFERVHAPLARMERVAAAYHHCPPEFLIRNPEVPSPMARDRNVHQDHQAVPPAASPFGGNERDGHMPSFCKTDADGNHPTPQNLRDNPERQAKIKTELCQFYIDGKKCPWGLGCNFAHGEHELKFRYSTLLLMEGSGQIANAYTYLCKPCLTFLSCGACPFGRRCTCIHDPRVQGPIEYPSWLPMATSKTNAQVIVDPMAAHRESAIHQENPLVSQSIWQHCRPSLNDTKTADNGRNIEFEDTYKIVCNTDTPVFLGKNERRSGRNFPNKLTELQKLCIVEHFRARQDRDFLYSPTHSLRGELCMLLQTRYFLVKDANEIVTRNAIVQEITLDEYIARITPWSPSHPYSPFKVVCGHEVAFAPKGEPTCNYSIWFDEEPVKLEQTQIKRSRRIKQKNKTNIKKGHTRPNANGALIVRTSPVDFRSGDPAISPFVYMIPAEDNSESNRLIDGIIAHRIDSIILAMSVNDADGEKTRELLDRKQQLQEGFEVIDCFHKKWFWPCRKGLDRITYSTQAPPGNAITYTPKTDDVGNNGLRDISNLWQGLVENISESCGNHERNNRLPVFHSLSLRSEGRPYPRLPLPIDDGVNNTWKQLLLGQKGEWSTARELYEAKMKGSAPARNLPLSTIPFVQN